MSRAQELLRTTPQCVLTIIFLCTITYIWQTTYQPLEHHYTMCPRAILFRHQYYRVFTSPYLHGNIFHVFMNMMSYITLGSYLEKSFGTIWHYTTIIWSTLAVNTVYILIAFALYQCGSSYGDASFNGHSLGFSGILFHLLVIQCTMNSSSTYPVFGLFHVSSKIYPWVLLFMIQLIMPHVSFMGHLSGIVVGQLHTFGYLNWIFPSSELLRSMDEWRVIRRIMMLSNHCQENYIKTPFSDEIFVIAFASRNTSSLMSSSPSSSSSPLRDIQSIVMNLFAFIKGFCETVKVKIFGHGREMNENIRLNDTEMNILLLGVGNSDDIGEEESCIGLQQKQQQKQQQGQTIYEHKSDLV